MERSISVKQSGIVADHTGQEYEVTATMKRHRRLDGKWTELKLVRSRCARCGAPYEFFVSAKASHTSPKTRCAKHATWGGARRKPAKPKETAAQVNRDRAGVLRREREAKRKADRAAKRKPVRKPSLFD